MHIVNELLIRKNIILIMMSVIWYKAALNTRAKSIPLLNKKKALHSIDSVQLVNIQIANVSHNFIIVSKYI